MEWRLALLSDEWLKISPPISPSLSTQAHLGGGITFALCGTKYMPFMTSGEWKKVSETAVVGKRLMGTAHALTIFTLITEPWSLQGSL